MQATAIRQRAYGIARGQRVTLTAGHLFLYAVVVAVVAFEVFPILWVFLTAFKEEREFFAYPPHLVFEPTSVNLTKALSHPMFFRSLVNTSVVSAVTTVLSVVLGVLMAYALARFRFRGADVILLGVIATRMVPRVTMLVPFFVMMRSLQLVNTVPALVITYTSFALPFAVWMLYGFFLEFPVELEDAARVDGCTRVQVLRYISLPLVAPGVAATAILTFIFAWNEFILALVLAGGPSQTLPVHIATYVTERQTIWGELFAASSVVILPVFVLALLVQRHLVRGLTAGAVKG